MELLASTYCATDAMSEVTKIYPHLKSRICDDDIKAVLRERNKELVEMAEEVLKKSRKRA